MKHVTRAILLLVASSLVTALEPTAETAPSLTIASNVAAADSNQARDAIYVSERDTERVLEKTLRAVSADLSVEIDAPFEAMFAIQ